jgi:DNA polymerase elongation subunit (family B)
MSKYYTNVCVHGNHILFRGVNNGKRVKSKVKYSPTLFLKSNKPSKWNSLFNEPLEPMTFDTIRETRDFVKRYEDVSNFQIFGNTRYEYAFIADTFRGNIDWDISHLSIAFIDIEVGSDNGFPDPYKATEPITAIGIHQLNGGTKVYGYGNYINNRDDVDYILCKDEIDLCEKFLKDWSDNCPDVITGWNTKFFDIPYIINRFKRILGEDDVKKLSPWEIISDRELTFKGKKQIAYEIVGVAALDYLELYQWYAPGGKNVENYKLETIANNELDETKLSYDEYDNLHQLYKLDYQKFIDYNIKDVHLVLALEDKLKLIELALTLAYDTKSNFGDVFAQTRMWDALIYNYLLDKNIVVPPRRVSKKSEAFEGAYVKDPQIGLHDYVASFDLNSLYPHLIMQYNVSPETLIDNSEYTDEMRKLSSDSSVESLLHKKLDLSQLKNVTITPNGQFFRTDKQGFLPKMMSEMYDDRKKFKKEMLKAQQDYENEPDKQKKKEIEKLIARYNNLQLAKKVSLNSAYGIMGSQYFRFYDLRIALAVTQTGQLSIRWIENKLNEYMNDVLKTNNDYVIASDTDSIYLNLGPLVKKVYGVDGKVTISGAKAIEFMDRVCERKIQPYIDESYQELADYVHAFEQKMQMKREGLSDKGIWTAKKRYILNVYNNEGVQYAKPKLKVMGLEMVKSSTPTVVRDKMYKVIDLVVNTDEETVQKFIADFRDEFKTLPVEAISFPRGCNGLSEYSDSVTIYKKGTPIHVKGAILYNHYLKQHNLTNKYPLIKEGEKLKFTYLKVPNPFKDMVVSFPTRLPKEFDLQKYIDYDTQFEKTFLDPIKLILNCIDWKTEKQSTLEDFFS